MFGAKLASGNKNLWRSINRVEKIGNGVMSRFSQNVY